MRSPLLSYYHDHPQAFSPRYLHKLQRKILDCPYFTVNNLNRDFVGTKGFSVVFRRSHQAMVEAQFPYFKQYMDRALQPDCNAFYLNPLLLKTGSRVDPHIDRSLRSYCKGIAPPTIVSVLYIDVPADLEGGELVLKRSLPGHKVATKGQVGKIRPQANTLLFFEGDLTHSITPMTGTGHRLSLVCEQYSLEEDELEEIPSLWWSPEPTLRARLRSYDQAAASICPEIASPGNMRRWVKKVISGRIQAGL